MFGQPASCPLSEPTLRTEVIQCHRRPKNAAPAPAHAMQKTLNITEHSDANLTRRTAKALVHEIKFVAKSLGLSPKPARHFSAGGPRILNAIGKSTKTGQKRIESKHTPLLGDGRKHIVKTYAMRGRDARRGVRRKGATI